MSFLEKALRGAGLEQRDNTLARPSQWLVDALTGASSTYTGRAVTPQNSLELIPVYSAIQLLSSAVGQLPLIVYQRDDEGGRERAPQHRAWKFLHDAPNDEMAADEFWALVEMHLLTWGNHFSAKLRNNPVGLVDGLWPVHPQRVQVTRADDGDKRYVVDGKVDEALTEMDILHIKGPSWDGTVGWSPIQMHRNGFAGMQELEEFTQRFWGNSATTSAVLEHPNKLGDEARKNLRASVADLHQSVKNAGRFAILEEGMTWKQISLPLEDAQFIETQKWNDVRAAQAFGLPAWMINANAGNSMTYSNTEMEGQHFVRYSLGRWLTRIEMSLMRDPSIFVQGSRYFAEFLVDAFMRASTKERYEAYGTALDKRFMTVNEVRRRENLPPLPDGDDLPAAPRGPAAGGRQRPRPSPRPRPRSLTVPQPHWAPPYAMGANFPHPATRRRATLAELREHFDSDAAPVERRVVSFDRAPEVRAKDDESTTRTFEGHAAVFDKRSEDLGFFSPIFEVIKRGAFKDAIKKSDVRFLIDHDGMPLARSVNGNGTLELSEDTRGLLAVADIDTRMSIVNDLVIALERGDVSQMSFAFRMGPGSEQTWTEEDDGTLIRTIHKIGELFDVSAVTFPAYPDTDAGLRTSIAAPSSAEQAPAAAAEEREHQAELDTERAGEQEHDSDEPWRAASRRRRLKQREQALRMTNRRKETSRARA